MAFRRECLLAIGGFDAQFRTAGDEDRKSTRLNSSHLVISYAVFCLKKKNGTGRPRSLASEGCQTEGDEGLRLSQAGQGAADGRVVADGARAQSRRRRGAAGPAPAAG